MKALEPVRSEAGRLQESRPTSAATSAADDAGGFVKGLDDGMEGLPEPKNAGPETIDFTAEGGKTGGRRENIHVADWGRKEGAGKRSTKPYAKSRPLYGPTQVEDVWNAHVDPVTGTASDPSGAAIVWNRTKPRNGQWDMGHIPEQRYADIHKRYMGGEISLKEFLDWYRNPDNYRPELPITNRSHYYENRDNVAK